MRYHEIIRETIKLTNEHMGVYKDQHDMSIRAYDDRKLVGYIDYGASRDGGNVFIKMIEVGKDYRGQGLARSMLKRLQDEYPDTEIDWGMLTDDGAALKSKIRFRSVPNEKVLDQQEQLSQARARLEHFEQMVAQLDGGPIPPDQIEQWHEMNLEWNRTHDAVSKLEHELYGKSPERRLMDFSPAS